LNMRRPAFGNKTNCMGGMGCLELSNGEPKGLESEDLTPRYRAVKAE